MSLSGALSNAMSGLSANSHGTSVISANIANALNEGYGRRTVELATDSNQSSGGVRVASITRYHDPVLAHQKRASIAEHAQTEIHAQAAADIEQLWGSVDTLGSVADKLTGLETALLSATVDPSSETRLRLVAHAAEDFVGAIRTAGQGIQSLRTQSDAAIANEVAQMNSTLKRLETLNDKIVLAKHLGQDTLGLQDQRGVEIDQLSRLVPLHVVERESGALAVFSSQGRTLLDGRAVEVEFTQQAPVLAHMTVGNGLLSSLSIDGQSVDAGANGPLSGGSLAKHFQVRDSIATRAQIQVDAIARDVIERFGPGGPDLTLGITDLGVFTDDGSPFVSTNELGLAQRIQLNPVLQASSSQLWRWRDGVMASAPGEVGQNSLLLSFGAQITEPHIPGSSVLGAEANSLLHHVQAYSNSVASDRVRRDQEKHFASSQLGEISEKVAANGVNTDQELQKLIELKKSYSANARVVQVVNDMLGELLNI